MGCENLHLSPKCKRLVSHIVSFAYFTILRIRTTRDSASPEGDSHMIERGMLFVSLTG